MPEVPFDEEAAKQLSSDEVKKRWPRLGGVCPDCHEYIVRYASMMHYIAGDW